MEVWQILLPAFSLSALMIFSHTYLGMHVLSRGIIFIDLALAQVAALGIALAFLLGADAHGFTAKAYAFTATIIAAFAFAGLRRIPNKVTREVIIGCVYVVATALAIVILSRTQQGMEELKSLFNGNILWVNWNEILLTGIVYMLLAIFHGVFYKQFYILSFAGDKEQPHSYSFLWEFLFFVSFAITITLAVTVAGVLLVFAFLIIPAFSASLFKASLPVRLLLGWLLGLLGSVAGLLLSYTFDLPTGATMVSVMGIIPLLAYALTFVRR